MYGSAPPPQPQQPQQPPAQPPQYGAPQAGPPYGAPQPPYNGPGDPYGSPQQYGGAPPPYGAPQQQFAYPAAPGPKKGNGLIIGLVVGAVVLVGGGIGAVIALHKSNPTVPIAQSSSQPAVNGPGSATAAPTAAPTTASTGSGTMSLPASAGGLVQLTTPAANQEVASVKSGVTSGGGSTYANALFGAYGPTSNGDATVVLVAQPFSNLDASDASQFESTSPSDAVSQILSSADATDVQTETSSDPNAAINCGNLAASGQTVLTCVWDDSVGFGFGYFFDSTDATSAAQQTDALRAAAEQ